MNDDEIAELQNERDELKAQLVIACEALVPFANCAADKVSITKARLVLYPDHFTAAREALTQSRPTSNPMAALKGMVNEGLEAIEERDAKLSIACEALGPLIETVGAWNPDDGTSEANEAHREVSAARDALAQCQPDADPLEELKALLRECRPLLLDPAETNANRRRGLVRKIDAAIGEEDELDKFGRSDGNVPLTETELIDQAADDDARREADEPLDHIPDVTKKVVDDE